MTSKAVSTDVHTDSERAVGELIGNSTGRYTFSIRRAFPQQHRSVGGAERTVRELKESLFVLRADLNAQRLDILFTYETLVDVLTCLALCNNHSSTSRGSDRSIGDGYRQEADETDFIFVWHPSVGRNP